LALSELNGEGTTWIFACNTSRFPVGSPGLRVEVTEQIFYGEALTNASRVIRTLGRGNDLRGAVMSLQIDGRIVAATSVLAGPVLVTQMDDSTK
jgi:hypothetical protein